MDRRVEVRRTHEHHVGNHRIEPFDCSGSIVLDGGWHEIRDIAKLVVMSRASDRMFTHIYANNTATQFSEFFRQDSPQPTSRALLPD